MDGWAVLSRRGALALIGGSATSLWAYAAAADGPWPAHRVALGEPLRQLRAGGPGGLLGIGASGTLWALSPAGAPRRWTEGLDPDTPLAVGHGRIAARQADGALWVWDGEREQRSAARLLAPHAGLLILPLAVIGVSSDAAAPRVLRLEPDGAGRWSVVARSTDPVLPDARPLQVDLDGRGDGGHVVVLAGPDARRYDHGVLGDGVEATRMLWLERHGLTVLRELALPAPQVFEDIAPRAVAFGRGTGLLTMRSGPAGAQLALVTADAASAGKLHVAAVGEALAHHRWLAPTTDGERLLAVHTPHIGGVLHEYRAQGDRLVGRVVARGVSTHRIGTRELDLAVWLGTKLVLPAQDGMSLRVLDPARDYAPLHSTALPARVQSVVVLPGAGMAALLDDGRVLSWPVP